MIGMQEDLHGRKMPVLFVGHGSPMNGIEQNEFSLGWEAVARTLPRPKAVLCISAHWETNGTFVTAMQHPRTIYDFYGFPPALYGVKYPAPGSAWLVQEIEDAFASVNVAPDTTRGLDHGCWIVLRRLFPGADIPVVQLSLDRTRPGRDHVHIAKGLTGLRRKDVLILGSGNMVHNLGMMSVKGDDFNTPFGYTWAVEANTIFKTLIDRNGIDSLADYTTLGRQVRMAVPTPEHYLPMLYALALREENEPLTYFNDKPVAGSITMTSFRIG